VSIELSPVRPTLVAKGWLILISHAAALLIALPFVDRPVLTLIFFGANALAFGLLSLLTWRYVLKRVAVPPPVDAVIVAERFNTPRQAVSIVLSVGIVALAVTRLVSPALLGVGFGSAIGYLWGARKIRQFERDDGRQVLRRTGQRTKGEPYLYAGR